MHTQNFLLKFNNIFFERDLIRERTIDGLESAKIRIEKEGRKLGRPKGTKDKNTRCKSGHWLRYATKKPLLKI